MIDTNCLFSKIIIVNPNIKWRIIEKKMLKRNKNLKGNKWISLCLGADPVALFLGKYDWSHGQNSSTFERWIGGVKPNINKYNNDKKRLQGILSARLVIAICMHISNLCFRNSRILKELDALSGACSRSLMEAEAKFHFNSKLRKHKRISWERLLCFAKY